MRRFRVCAFGRRTNRRGASQGGIIVQGFSEPEQDRWTERTARSQRVGVGHTFDIARHGYARPDLLRIAKLRWRIEHDYRELKTALGLDHFEGRSFTGWHRRVTLVTAGHLFLTEQRRTSKNAKPCP
ncbi:transposase [Streptomyces noursei]|uniref:transposase n=1 Tax=Streptomyces noursei TaxID=1971 RepID=UPI00367F0EA1